MAPSATAGRFVKQESRDIKSEPSTEDPVKEERPGSIGHSATDVSPLVKPEPVVAIKPDSVTQERVQEGPVKKERPGTALWNIPEHNQDATRNETDSREPASDAVEPWDSAVAGPLFASRDAFRVGFGHLLDKVETTVPFFASQSIEAAINPGLQIQGISSIGLPVSLDAAEAILRGCHCRPVPEHASSDGQTAVSYELDDGQFICRNPRWHRQVSSFARKGIAKLGVAEPDDLLVRAEKCIVFREGSFFMPETRPHNEPEYQEHVGTLAICLPSKHEGGDIMVSYSGQVEAITTSTNSEFQFSFAIFSMLGPVRGTRVTSGYRVVLTYSLLHRPTSKALLYRHLRADSIADALTRWTMLAERRTDSLHDQGLPPSAWFSRVMDCAQLPPPAVIYKLHAPPDFDLDFTFNTLRPDDRVRLTELRRLCNASNCHLLLAYVRYKITGIRDESDHGSSRGLDYPNLSHPRVSNFRIREAKDLDGNLAFLSAEGDESLSTYDLQGDVQPIAETRLQGPVMGRQYAHPVALVVPEPFYGPLLLRTAKDRELWKPIEMLKDLYRDYQACPESEKLRSQVSELCEILASPDPRSLTRDAVLDVAPIALEIGNLNVVAKCLDSLGRHSERLAEHIGKAIYIHGVQHMQPV